MNENELAVFNQRMLTLTEALTCLSMQLSAAIQLGMTAMPKVQQEFEAIKAMAKELGIPTEQADGA